MCSMQIIREKTLKLDFKILSKVQYLDQRHPTELLGTDSEVSQKVLKRFLELLKPITKLALIITKFKGLKVAKSTQLSIYLSKLNLKKNFMVNQHKSLEVLKIINEME